MATTLTLIEALQVDTRRNGDIFYAKVRVLLDGAEIATDFRAKVGEEPVMIDGGTITVSDAQVEAKRQAQAYYAADAAKRAAAAGDAIDAARAKLEGFIAKKSAAAAAAAELRAHFDANSADAAGRPGERGYDAFSAGVRAIVARHAL